MDKEKEIEEMAKVIMKAIPNTIRYVQAPANEVEARMEAEALVNAGYGDAKQAVSEFAGEVFKGLSDFLAKKHITSANEVKQIIRRAEENCFGEKL